MLVIRYFRVGKTNQPYFKVVVTDKRRPTRGGRFVEELGQVDPVNKKKNLKADRVKYWLSVGAQPSDTVYNLLVSEKIIEGKKRDVHKKKKLKKGEVVAPAQAPASAAAKSAPIPAPAPVSEPVPVAVPAPAPAPEVKPAEVKEEPKSDLSADVPADVSSEAPEGVKEAPAKEESKTEPAPETKKEEIPSAETK
jgi:small subunit ribosomal protein S16